MDYFKKILRFAAPYRKYGFLNIFFNILYALFSALSFAALIPMLDVLFDKSKKVTEPPVYQGLGNLKEYLQTAINYRITSFSGNRDRTLERPAIQSGLVFRWLRGQCRKVRAWFSRVLGHRLTDWHRSVLQRRLLFFPNDLALIVGRRGSRRVCWPTARPERHRYQEGREDAEGY